MTTGVRQQDSSDASLRKALTDLSVSFYQMSIKASNTGWKEIIALKVKKIS
ncbi:hypothetical protein ACFLZG_06590 [Thermodesulfobacteriota bacterium]